MVFVDGWGLGDPDPAANPFLSARLTTLEQWVGREALFRGTGRVCGQASLVPVDPSLGVEGLPQSATGQTTILTGINAAAAVGKHLNAFPTPALKEMLRCCSLFKQVRELGLRATFLNAYRDEFFRHDPETIPLSTSTVAVMSAGIPLRRVSDLLAGEAVYHDIINRVLVELGYAVPIVGPETAGERAARVAARHDFTFFEFFLTDVVGHSRDMLRAVELLERIDRFLGAVERHSDLATLTLMVVSDHGNVEDLGVKTHTRNPVPAIILGRYRDRLAARISSLQDIAPAVLEVLRDA